jgi:predicted DNA-binding transcriptional regulator AlpA
MQDNPTWLTARKVCTRFSVSSMGLWRWCHDPRLEFPQPVKIRGRNLWRLADIESFERRLITKVISERAA